MELIKIGEINKTFIDSFSKKKLSKLFWVGHNNVVLQSQTYSYLTISEPVLIAKSNIILDVKPWDDETDMKAMEEAVRKINTDGLLWGAAKLVPLAYSIKKLQISCVVEDDKVSIDWLTEEIEKIEDLVSI